MKWIKAAVVGIVGAIVMFIFIFSAVQSGMAPFNIPPSAAKVTKEPARMTRDDVKALRKEGFSDEASWMRAQFAAYFNYINRMSDALGIELEPEFRGQAASG